VGEDLCQVLQAAKEEDRVICGINESAEKLRRYKAYTDMKEATPRVSGLDLCLYIGLT